MNKKLQLIALTERCANQMQLEVCNGCDACGLRCAKGVPATKDEWKTLQDYIANVSKEQKQYIDEVEGQDKWVDLGDEVKVEMCRYRDVKGGCAVYPARPLVCRLLGHVEWLPCPIEKVPKVINTQDALDLMQSYVVFERKTFEEWEKSEEILD